jgi:hypothetical protein
MKMTVEQISVFIENKPGALAELTGIMGDAGIDMRALSLADSTDFGVLRAIVDDSGKALELLRTAGFAVSVTQVLAVPITDSPGGLAKVLRALSDENVNVEYSYAFITRKHGKAYVILRVENNEVAQGILTKKGIITAPDENIFEQ